MMVLLKFIALFTFSNLLLSNSRNAIIAIMKHVVCRLIANHWLSLQSSADCGAPPPPVNGFLQPRTNTTEGSVVVFHCDPGFVPEGVMTAVCGRDGQWTPNPGGVTCSPRPTQVITLASPQTTILVSTPIQTSTPTGENKLPLLCSPAHYFSACKHIYMSSLHDYILLCTNITFFGRFQ